MKRLAVVGATGAVGQEVIKVLEARKVELETVRFFASSKSVGAKRKVVFRGQKISVEDLASANFREFDLAIFSVGAQASKHYAPIAKSAGCVVIDNSSAFRMDLSVPLVVPEINARDLNSHRGIIANPNCTTAITLMALYPLHAEFEVVRASITSYQAASGAGAKGLVELRDELIAYSREIGFGDCAWKQKKYSDIFPHPIALNVFPHIGTFISAGGTDEELKFLREAQKIMDHPRFQASATCVRVPVERVHSVDVLAQFRKPVDLPSAFLALNAMRGLDVFEGDDYPTPLQYAGKYNCAVGRVRIDQAFDNALRFWVVGDQLLKGAALNAVQILEYLLK